MSISDALKELISFKTTTYNHAAIDDALAWVRDTVSDYPVSTKEVTVDDYSSLIITTQDTKTPTLWLAAHMDVVPARDSAFIAREKDGRLFGRGAYDMKFAIASYLKLLDDLGEMATDYNFGIMITPDEETGGMYGTKQVLDAGYVSDVCFLPDGGTSETLVNFAKGKLELRIESKGQSAHASRCWEGLNAITQLMDFLKELQQKIHEGREIDEAHRHRSMNIGVIDGGTQSNVVPNHAESFVDIRYVSEKEYAQIVEEIIQLADTYETISVEHISHGDVFETSLDDEYVQEFSAVFEEVNARRPGVSFDHGASDARFFSDRNIPTIMTRPRGGNHHATNEWVDLNDLDRFYQTLKTYVTRVA